MATLLEQLQAAEQRAEKAERSNAQLREDVNARYWDKCREENTQLRADLERVTAEKDRLQRNLDTAQSALCGASDALRKGDAHEAHGWLTRREAYEKARARDREMQERVAELEAEVERLRGENYQDLYEQMREAWGGHFDGVCSAEVWAFLESRATHMPTTSLRADLAAARERIAYLESLDRDVDTYPCGCARQSLHDPLTCVACDNSKLREQLAEWENPDSPKRHALLEEIVFNLGEGNRSEIELREGQLELAEARIAELDEQVEAQIDVVARLTDPTRESK